MIHDDYELILFDRLEVIRTTINKYGEENFYISFSGGKDSTILHYLVDMALPKNHIPRVYADTGINLKMVDEFVRKLSETDERIIMIKPSLPVIPTLQKYGYPFKSKHHSYMVEKFQRLGLIDGVKNYIGIGEKNIKKTCPKKLLYQFDSNFKIKISDLCCLKMKEEPLQKWGKEHNKQISITGLMKEEGGRRISVQCLKTTNGKVKFFNPLAKITKEFENWFINKYQIKLCDIYYPPYSFERTGCKGCPFAINIQHELKVLKEKLPSEYHQCNVIWKPIYDEYRRIGYRLKEND